MKDFSIEVHGAHTYDATGAISEPIYLSATFRHPGFQQSTGYDYGRVANPTRKELEAALTLLERGGRTWAMSSGMAAINIVLMLFKAGDHILFSNDLYGGTVRLANEIYAHYGIEATYVDTSDLAAVKKALRPATKLVYIETPSNPMMIISDIQALSDLAHENGALLAVDNTFLSPHFQKPLALGADLVLHSGTKYLCGHNDVIAGFLTVKDQDSELAERIQRLVVSSGPNLSTMDAVLGRLKLIAFAESLGGVESLLTYPKVQTHAEMPEDLMKATGLDDKLLRLSVGLEDAEDLIADLEQALQA